MPTARRADVEDAAIARVVTRMGGEYVLRATRLLIETFGDVRAGLIVQTIDTANNALPTLGPSRRQAAVPGGVSPDAARRPIRVSRLAETAGLPFETTRRIVQRLIETGACMRVEGGVIVPRATLESVPIVRNTMANLAYVRRLVRDLRAVGLIAGEVAPVVDPATRAEDAELAVKVAPFSSRYVLRALRLLAETYGDIRIGMAAQAILTANTAHLETRAGEGWRYAGIYDTPPNEILRPISVYGLAESLGTPYETTRAQVKRLRDAGVCVRIDRGYIVPKAVLETPAALRATLTGVGYVREFVRDVDAVGLA